MASLHHLIKALLAIIVAATAGATASAATFSVKRGLSMDIWVTWPDARSWGDREVLLPFPEWRKHVGPDKLAALRDANLDFVRVPVDPAPFLSSLTEPFRQELYYSVLETVRMVNAAGLKAIVDLHTYPQGSGDRKGTGEIQGEPETFSRYLEFVRQMAGVLSGEDPAQVALEVMNEPTAGCGGMHDKWNEMRHRLYAAARASATQLTLVIPGGCWSDAESLAATDPATLLDDNIVWTFHSYAPFLMTHQGASWTGDFISHVTGLPFPLHSVSSEELERRLDIVRKNIGANAPFLRRSGMLAYLDELVAEVNTEQKLTTVMAEPFSMVAKWAEIHGINPGDILLGEFGMIRQEYGNSHVTPAKYRAAYYRAMIELAEKHGFSWSMWGYGGAFGVAEEFENRPAEPDVMDMVRALSK